MHKSYSLKYIFMFPHLRLLCSKTIQLMVDPQLGHPANPIHPSWRLSEWYSEITRPQAEFLLLACFPAPIRIPPCISPTATSVSLSKV